MHGIKKFFHHLFTPHCAQCEHVECRTCDTFHQLLVEERFENKRLLDRLLELTHPQIKPEGPIAPDVDYKSLKAKYTPWHVKQAMLEADDRLHAEKLKKNLDKEIDGLKTTEELEQELLGGDINGKR